MTDTYGFAPDLFRDRTVVITGAGEGIGRAALDAFVATGARVIAHPGRERERDDWPAADATAEHGLVASIAGDFTDRRGQDAFVAEVLQQTARVDVLVNNAGTMVGRFPIDDLADDDYERVVSLNQTAVVRITRGLLPALKSADAPSIVNTVSISASTGGSAGSSIYSATKAFVSTFSKSMAKELAPDGIRVNSVSPGVIDTDFHQRYSSREKLERTKAQIPLGRLGTPADCAPAFLFLASARLSGYVTGQVLEINGGQY